MAAFALQQQSWHLLNRDHVALYKKNLLNPALDLNNKKKTEI